MQDDAIWLVSATMEQDAIGQQIHMESRRRVLCQIGEISRREWYDAGSHGLKPEIMFRVFCGDYSGEEIVEYNGIRYAVYRTYRTDQDTVELYCERRAGA